MASQQGTAPIGQTQAGMSSSQASPDMQNQAEKLMYASAAKDMASKVNTMGSGVQGTAAGAPLSGGNIAPNPSVGKAPGLTARAAASPTTIGKNYFNNPTGAQQNAEAEARASAAMSAPAEGYGGG